MKWFSKILAVTALAAGSATEVADIFPSHRKQITVASLLVLTVTKPLLNVFKEKEEPKVGGN